MEGDYYHDIELPNGRIITLPRVTAALKIINKPGLNQWRAKLGIELSDQYSEETSEIGSQIHAFVAQLARGEAITPLEWTTLDEMIKNGIRAYERFRKEHNYKPRLMEQMVYSLKHGYAGTIDSIGDALVAGSVPRHIEEIIDWKSGSRIWPEHVLQIAAYVFAWNERQATLHTPHPIYRARIVSLNRETGIPIYRIVEMPELDRAFKAFKHALALFNYFKEER